MARISRKELKSDAFADEIGLGITFFEEHQKDVIRYGGIGAAVLLLVGGFILYQRHDRTARQEELEQAIRLQEAPVANVSAGGGTTFPTQAAKDQATIRAFSDLERKHSGSDEGEIAGYYLGCVYADEGKMADAEKAFQNVVNHGGKNYGSLAKLSLAQVYFDMGNSAPGEALLRDLMDHPTIFVSKDQAALALAKHYTGKNNAEARKLLAPIKDGKSAVASLAQSMYAQLPPQ